jgi:hypothetical protein
MFVLARRGKPKRVLDRKVEPLAVHQIWSSLPLVAAFAALISFAHLPSQVATVANSGPSPVALVPGRDMVAPEGWVTTRVSEYHDVQRLYGDGAVVARQWMTATSGNPRFDKLARPRTVVVDSLVSSRPFTLRVYPDRVLYGLTSARISAPRSVDLGFGVTGEMTSVVDDALLVTWNSIQFSWGTNDLAQSVMVFAVDNHEPEAPFPEPSATLVGSGRTLITLLFRGNAVLDQRTPSFKDSELLTEFTRALVAAQFPSPGDTR